jgi:hypothetical protein
MNGVAEMSNLQTDYLVVGAGAMAMSFVDTLLSETDADVTMVDRRYRPGGHWNDAYPFVRLHQPSASYGVSSRELSNWTKDKTGLNQGLYGLASGAEVLAHFEQVLHDRFLPSGRVRWLPMSEYSAAPDGAHCVRAARAYRSKYTRSSSTARSRAPKFPPPINQNFRSRRASFAYRPIGCLKSAVRTRLTLSSAPERRAWMPASG